MGRSGQLGQVPELPGAVVDRGVRDEGDVGTDLAQPGRDLRRRDPLDGEAGQAGGSVEDVEVGGERVGVGEHHAPVRAHPGGRDEDLEEVHRRRVGDHRLPGGGADESPDPVTDPLRGAPPVGLVPRPDQPVAPLAFRHVGESRRDGAGQGAERVAVEVDQVVRHGEQLRPEGAGVLGLQMRRRAWPGRRGRPPSDAIGPRRRHSPLAARRQLRTWWPLFRHFGQRPSIPHHVRRNSRGRGEPLALATRGVGATRRRPGPRRAITSPVVSRSALAIGVLAVQGDVREHVRVLTALGARATECVVRVSSPTWTAWSFPAASRRPWTSWCAPSTCSTRCAR